MTKKRLEELNEAEESIERAREIRNIFMGNHVEIKSPKSYSVSTVGLDKKTRDNWIEINRVFFEKRIKKLEEEFERM